MKNESERSDRKDERVSEADLYEMIRTRDLGHIDPLIAEIRRLWKEAKKLRGIMEFSQTLSKQGAFELVEAYLAKHRRRKEYNDMSQANRRHST